MRSIISVNTINSTVTSPLRFFEKFYNKEGLQTAYDFYLNQMPNINDPDSEWNKFPLTLDLKNKKWSVEYQIETSYDQYKGSTYQYLTREYTFENELLNLLRDEFYISKGLFNKKIIDSKEDKRKKDLARNFIYKCLEILDKIESNGLSQYNNILSRPIKSLIRFAYLNFKEFVPDQKIDKRLGEVLKEKESSRDIYESTGLSPDLATEVLNIKDNVGNPVVNYLDESDLENLKLFLSKNFSAIKGNPIRLIGEVGIVSYLLVRIILISGLRLKDAQEQAMFKINGSKFYANYASNEKYRISFRNEYVMFQIDRVISAHGI
jgi:hypothetical protein